MNKIDISIKKLLSLFIICVVSIFSFIKISCIFKTITGIPCPGCGGRRALKLLLEGKIVDSFVMNPTVVIGLVGISIYLLIHVIKFLKNDKFELYTIKLNKFHYPVLFGLTLLNWYWNIQKKL